MHGLYLLYKLRHLEASCYVNPFIPSLMAPAKYRQIALAFIEWVGPDSRLRRLCIKILVVPEVKGKIRRWTGGRCFYVKSRRGLKSLEAWLRKNKRQILREFLVRYSELGRRRIVDQSETVNLPAVNAVRSYVVA